MSAADRPSAKAMLRLLVVLSVILVGASAHAQDATPTPELPRARRSSIPDPGVTPSFGIFSGQVFAQSKEGVVYTSMLPIHLGATFHPMPARVSPFSNVGLEMDFRFGERSPDFVPIGRFGIAILTGGDPEKFVTQLFPAVELYSIAGWRIARAGRGDAARVGVGVASPILMLKSVGLGSTSRNNCVPAPSMIEATMDVSDFKGGPREYQLRFGWFF